MKNKVFSGFLKNYKFFVNAFRVDYIGSIDNYDNTGFGIRRKIPVFFKKKRLTS